MKLLSKEELIQDYAKSTQDKARALMVALENIERNPQNASIELAYLNEKIDRLNNSIDTLKHKINL